MIIVPDKSDADRYAHELTTVERDELVTMSQNMNSLAGVGRVVGVSSRTLDRLVCHPWRRARTSTIARVRRALAVRRVVVHMLEGTH